MFPEFLLPPAEALAVRGPPAGPSFVAPLTRSLAVPAGRLMPSQSGPYEQPTEHFATEDNATNWTPWGVFAAGVRAVLQSSGPLAGRPTRPAIGSAYITPESLWNLAGIATGWSRPYQATPGRPPTAKMALGAWSPGAGGHAPLPTLPEPAAMVRPGL